MRSVLAFLLVCVSSLAVAQQGAIDEQAEALLSSMERRVAAGGAVAVDPLKGRLVTIETAIGTQLQGFVAGPEGARQGILLLHDRWGLDQTMRQRVEAFAARGYRALAIDVFDGRASDEWALATEILEGTDPEWVKSDVLAGVAYLQAPARKVAVMGWGFGGWQAYQAALLASDRIDAAIVWYAPLYNSIQEARAISAPLLGIFASEDVRVSAQMIAAYEGMMKKSANVFRNYVYEAGHGFADPNYKEAFNEREASAAWEHVDRFLAAFVEE